MVADEGIDEMKDPGGGIYNKTNSYVVIRKSEEQDINDQTLNTLSWNDVNNLVV